jgi:KDO2-lipid IV(A) lauroyltransferase
VRFALQDGFAATLFALGRIVPRAAMIRLGGALGRLQYRLDVRRRRTTLQNLRWAYGDALSEEAVATVARRCWSHFGRIGLEALTFPQFGPEDIGVRIRYSGLDHIRGAYARGKGVLLFSGHYGNWELIALMQGWLGLPLALITRPLDNPRLERRLAALRSLSGNVVVHRSGAVREMLRQLQRGIGVAIVIDQDARESGIFVPFFGRPASTTPTPALAALRTGAAIVPVFSVPREDGGYDVTYEPEIEVRGTGNRDADVLRVTTEMTAILERRIREHPHLWTWMHRRWRTVPPTP